MKSTGQKVEKTYWAGFVDGKPHAWGYNLELYKTKTEALARYDDVRKVKVFEVKK